MRLVINTGSTSRKFAVYDENKCVISFRFEDLGEKFILRTKGEAESEEEISSEAMSSALSHVISLLSNIGISKEDIQCVGVRIVSPGSFFTEHRIIDETYIAELKSMEKFAPLHIPGALSEIYSTQKNIPDARIIGVSDSAFHKTTSKLVRKYSIKKSDTEDFDIYRFGYHGSSVQSVLRAHQNKKHVIVCHVGGGASITAVKGGESVDTSMGWSPMSGLHMSSRSGDVDPDAVLHLMEKSGMNIDQTREYLYKKSGLKGVVDNMNIQELLNDYHERDEAKEAVDMYTIRIKKYIGSYIALLGGLDALILTGTVNERNSDFRRLAYGGLEHLGIEIDETRNNGAKETKTTISSEASAVDVIMQSTDEMAEINANLSAFNGTNTT